MDKFKRASKVVAFYTRLIQSGDIDIFELLINERLEELKLVGVTPHQPPNLRDNNAGAYNELDNLLIRLEQQTDEARELLDLDKEENPPDGDSKQGG